MFKNRNLFIIAIVAVVNALGYGIIIPIMYSYSIKFGLSDFENGLLFALFSICQFIATPIIGRLSDKYGRRPLLISSIFGTALSFFLLSVAPSAIFLFLARALDGITAGNIPVAYAVISDTTEVKDRARGFGIIGASFGFGFLFGPAISAVTYGISPSLPFIIAGIISTIAAALTFFLLPETNKHIGEVKQGKIFDLAKLYHALFDKNIGPTLLISLFFYMAFFCYIFGFQVFTVKTLHMSPTEISLVFTLLGLLGIIMQAFFVQRITKTFGLRKTFSSVLLFTSVTFFAMYFITSIPIYIFVSLFIGFANSLVQPLIPTILSQETDEKSQGSIQGLSASYMSIGQIFGPIIGGALSTISIPLPFIASSIMVLICYGLSFLVLRPGVKKESAF